jgi:uncharacterized protein YheU (UPF0270 family)
MVYLMGEGTDWGDESPRQTKVSKLQTSISGDQNVLGF